MKCKIVITTFISLILDQIIKFFCNLYLDSIIVIPGFLSFTYAENSGVAFSMLDGNRILILLISMILIYILINFLYKDYISKNENNTFREITFGLLMGGILGNLIDRIIRGFVIDYVSINIFGYGFPIFNLADVLITISVLLISVSYLKDSHGN